MVGNVNAMLTAVEIGAAQTPLTLDDLQSLHGALMSTSNIPTDVERAGEFRTDAVFIGGTNPTNADYVGPPAEMVTGLLDDLVAFINDRTDLSPVVQAALAHAQYESIHPHHDGNGRVGRCLVNLILRRQAAAVALPPLSIAFARPQARYVEDLTAYRAGDVDAWMSAFSQAVTFSARAAQGLGAQVQQLRNEWESRLREARSAPGRRAPREDSAVMLALDVLVELPAFHARDLAEHLGRTWRSAQDAIIELVAAGIVKQVSAGKGNRLYEVPEVFALLDGFEHHAEKLLPGG